MHTSNTWRVSSSWHARHTGAHASDSTYNFRDVFQHTYLVLQYYLILLMRGFLFHMLFVHCFVLDLDVASKELNQQCLRKHKMCRAWND